MNQTPKPAAYICPMHASVRQVGPGRCPTCGMALVPEGTRFALLRHMFANPVHLAIMLVIMVAIMVAMVLMR